MPRLKLMVANAGDHFGSNDITRIRAGVRAAERFVAARLPLDYDIDLIVTSPSFLMPIIPEDGISGRTFNSRLIMLVIDPSKTTLEDFVFETVCHELSHSLRWEKLPDRADTLLKAILFEGLATVFEESALTQSKYTKSQFFLNEIRQTSENENERIRTQLEPSFDEANYDYGAIFYDGNDSLPRWSAYKLGYALIREHMDRTGTDIVNATIVSYDELISGLSDRR